MVYRDENWYVYIKACTHFFDEYTCISIQKYWPDSINDHAPFTNLSNELK